MLPQYFIKVDIQLMKSEIKYHIILLIVAISFQFCIKEKLPPVARFSMTPPFGNTESTFVFDASLSRNDRGINEGLLARWDWENDGEWNTKFSPELIVEHLFDEPGIYSICLQIKDKDGQKAIITRDLTVTVAGPLYIPQTISPIDKAVNQDQSITLSWSCFHSEGQNISYDIYFGEIPTPPLYKEDYKSTILNPGFLESSTEYYWRIVAKDEEGNVSNGTLNRFTTHMIDERDNRKYNIFKVYNTYWMAENLNYQTDSGYWCYDDSPYNCNIYGKLYNLQAAMVACPPGWHLPSDVEWKQFEMSLGMTDVDNWGPRGTVQGDKIKEGGTHPFNALMAGTRNFYGEYKIPEIDAGFWTSTGNIDAAYYRYLYFEQSYIYRNTLPGVYGLSVRCVKD